MNYWWVNQNQTYDHEVGGGYMWSPKRSRNGRRNHFYENMKEVAPGDLVFSFNNKLIACIGIATSYSFEATRPAEFGSAGSLWNAEGWRVCVDYHHISPTLKPSEHMDVLAPTIPSKYSPIREDGGGNQVYLAKLPVEMAAILINLIGPQAKPIVDQAAATKSGLKLAADSLGVSDSAEDEIEKAIAKDPVVAETEKKALIAARKGQGLFRQRVAVIEAKCRVTGVTNPLYRIASHIKPWRKSNNQERLDGENGLLLAPHIDHLFDKGFISFAADGTMLVSPAADRDALEKLGIPLDTVLNVGAFTPGQKAYLEFHRTEIFRKVAE